MIFAKLTEWNMSVSHREVQALGSSEIDLQQYIPPEFTLRLDVVKADCKEVERLSKESFCVLLDRKEYSEFLHWKTNKAIMDK